VSRDRWQGLLDGTPLFALAELAARRRFARERSEEEEDEFDPPAEVEEDIRLAAADTRQYRGGAWTVVVDGREATQTAGPGGLTLRISGAAIPLVRDVAVPLPEDPGDTIEAQDARGRSVRLTREP